VESPQDFIGRNVRDDDEEGRSAYAAWNADATELRSALAR